MARGILGMISKKLYNFTFVHKNTGNGDDYTATKNDYIIGADTNDSTLTVTLPSNANVDGKFYVVNDEGGNAGTNAITINTEGDENIDGGSSITISSNNGSVQIYSDGSNWYSL